MTPVASASVLCNGGGSSSFAVCWHSNGVDTVGLRVDLTGDGTMVLGRAWAYRNDNLQSTGFFDTNFWLQRCQAIDNTPRNCVNLAQSRETWDVATQGTKAFLRPAPGGYIYQMCARWTSTFGWRYQNATGCSGFIANPT